MATPPLPGEPDCVTVSPHPKAQGGDVPVQGSKNAALPLIAALALAPPGSILANMPALSDVTDLLALIGAVGIAWQRSGAELRAERRPGGDWRLDPAIVTRSRAAVYASAVAYVRHGRVFLPLPGGDRIAGRDLAPHLRAFTGIGAKVDRRADGYLIERAEPPRRAFVLDDKVGGVTASCLALLLTTSTATPVSIRGVTAEPEVCELAAFLRHCGATIEREGETVHVGGALSTPTSAKVSTDRVVWGTYAIAAALSGSSVTLPAGDAALDRSVVARLAEAGIDFARRPDGIGVTAGRLCPFTLATGPYPAFPSDLAPLATLLMAFAPGTSRLEEWIYPSRFDHIPNLVARGLQASVAGHRVEIRGGRRLAGGEAIGCGIRETATLALSGLVSAEQVVVRRAGALARGYQDFVGDLCKIGIAARYGAS